ncbi:hypothetical protein LP420_01690 [Massilia sp. B-10]|nr:hypothetical protein LP420_01690 [Massilia sp. B-10]
MLQEGDIITLARGDYRLRAAGRISLRRRVAGSRTGHRRGCGPQADQPGADGARRQRAAGALGRQREHRNRIPARWRPGTAAISCACSTTACTRACPSWPWN